MIYKSFKTEINPNKKQIILLNQYVGTARFAYNWGLALLQEDYKLNKKIKPSAITLHKLLVSKKENEFNWMKNVSKWCPQNALRNLEAAFKRFFKKKAKFPKFKKKGLRDSFTLDAPIHVRKEKIKLPKIGWINLKEFNYIPEGQPKSATVSKKANRWFISIQYEIESPKQKQYAKDLIGVDLGVKTLATISDGEIFDSPVKLKQKEKQLKRLQRKMARQVKDSKSREKTKLKYKKYILILVITEKIFFIN